MWQGKIPWASGILAAAAISLVQYGATLTQPFEYGDMSGAASDTALVLGRLRGGLGLSQIFGPWHPTVYFRPISMLWLVGQYAVFGEHPFGFRLTNLLLHIGVLILVALAAWKASKSTATAIIAMLAFAVFGRHRSAVIWVWASAEPLCALFYLGAVAALLSANRAWLWSLPLFALALGAKEMAASLPLLVSAWALLLGQRKRWSAAACIWAVFLAYLAVRFKTLGFLAAGTGHQVPWRESVTVYLAFLADPVIALIQAPRTFLFSPWTLIYRPFLVFLLREAVFWLVVYVFLRQSARLAAAFFLWKAIAYLPAFRYVIDLTPYNHYFYLPDVGGAMIVGLAVKEVVAFVRAHWRSWVGMESRGPE